MIRKAVLNDAKRLQSIIQTCYRENVSWTNEFHLVSGERISVSELEEKILAQKDLIFTATIVDNDSEEEIIAGCIQIELNEFHPQEIPPKSCVFGLLAVDPIFQSKGIGGSLIKFAEEYAKKSLNLQIGLIWVINHRTDIQKWYHKLGYKYLGETKPFVMPDLAKLDNTHFLVYKKQL